MGHPADTVLTAGAVLTGGAGRRMGGGKPLAPFRGQPLAQWVIDAMRDGGCDPIVTVGGDPSALANLTAAHHVGDQWPGEGPLAGTISALDALFDVDDPPQFVVVAACDLGQLDAATVFAVRSAEPAADVVVARGARLHPSLARYSRRGAGVARERFEAGERAMHRFITAARDLGGGVVVVDRDVDEQRLVNINTPGDLRR